MTRRIITSLLLLFCLSMSLAAQSLQGSWRTYFDEPDNHNGAFMYLTFDNNGGAQWKMTMRMEDVEVGQMDFSFHIKATYTHADKQLVIRFDPKSVRLQIDRVAWSGELAREFFGNPDLEGQVKQLMMNELEKQKDEFAKSFPTEWNCTIVDLTDNTLMFNDGTKTTTWSRFRE